MSVPTRVLASTALVLSAGVAAADIALSGNAWMGLQYNNAAATNKTQMISRARVTFTMSGETDTGLAFGASFGAHNAANAGTGLTNNGSANVFISGEFGKLSMGDVDSALEATWFRTRHIGVLENGAGSRAAAIGTVNTGALYEYSLDGFKAALGAGQLNNNSQNLSIGVSYSMDGYGVALGAENVKNAGRHIMLSAQGSFEDVSLRAFYGHVRAKAGGVGLAGVAAGNSAKQYGADLHASFDDIGVQVRAKRDFRSANHIGLGVTYNLGGGANLGASINRVSSDPAPANNGTTADFGLAFTF